MEKKLPARPNLEHLRGQSKALLAAIKSGDTAATAALAEHHRGPSQGPPGLSDAQFVIARKHGFASWPKLVRYVEELCSLEDTWSFTSLEIDGNAMPKPAYASAQLILDGDRFRMVSKEATYEGIFDIDVEVEPHTIDIDFIEGPEAGNSSYGIYELNGADLKICLGFTGVERPTDFVTKQGNGHALETLRRASGTSLRFVTSATTETPEAQEEPVRRADFEEVTPVLERLHGEWNAVSIIRFGMPLPSHFCSDGKRVSEGNSMVVTFGEMVWLRALCRVDGTKHPVEIDYLLTAGPSEGRVQLGIMRWIGGGVQFCIAEPGSPRPEKFSSESGSSHILSTWRRRG